MLVPEKLLIVAERSLRSSTIWRFHQYTRRSLVLHAPAPVVVAQADLTQTGIVDDCYL